LSVVKNWTNFSVSMTKNCYTCDAVNKKVVHLQIPAADGTNLAAQLYFKIFLGGINNRHTSERGQ